MKQQVDYKQKYTEARLELIDTKARLATIESMYSVKTKKPKTSPSKTELKLRGRVESLENLLMHYKEEGLKALMNSDII